MGQSTCDRCQCQHDYDEKCPGGNKKKDTWVDFIEIGPSEGNKGAIIRWGKHKDNGVWLLRWEFRDLWSWKFYWKDGWVRLWCFDIHWRNL